MLEVGGVDVIDDADAVTKAVGTAPLDRLPDRWKAEGFARMDGEVGVLASQIFESVKVTGGRKAGLSSSDIEADHAPISVLDRELSYLLGMSSSAHGCEEHTNTDPATVGLCRIRSLGKSRKDSVDDLVERKALLHVKLGSEPDLG